MEPTSADAARRELTDFSRCPACGATLTGPRCAACGLALDGPVGVRIADASREAVRALDARHAVIEQARAAQSGGSAAPAPVAGGGWFVAPAGPPVGRPAPVGPARPGWGPPPVGRPGAPAAGPFQPRPSPVRPYPAGPGHPGPSAAPTVDVARLLALAGAGLVAAAALVFAFFVLADQPGARVLVLLLATGLAATGTLMLRRTGIGSSAEAVGGLVAALCVVDAWVAAYLADGSWRWVVLAVLLLVVGVGVPVAGLALRVRSWTTLVLVLPVVPLSVAGAVGSGWAWNLGLLGAALATLVRTRYRRRVHERFGGTTDVVDALLTVAAVGLLAGAVAQSVSLDPPARAWVAGGTAIALLLAAGVARAQAVAGGATAWTASAGALAVLAGGLAPVGSVQAASGVAALAAAAVWAVLVLVPRRRGRERDAGARYRALVSGGWVALVVVALPGVLAGGVATLALLGAVDLTLPTTLPGDAYAASVPGAGLGPALAAVVLAGACAGAARLRLAAAPAPALPLAPASGSALPAAPRFGSLTPVAGAAGAPAPVAPRRAPAVVRVALACLPLTAVLAVVLGAGLLRPWAVPLLVAEALVAVALVEVARRVPPRRALRADHPLPGPWRGTLTGVAAGQVALLGLLTWSSRPTIAVGAVVVVLLVLRARALVAAELRGVLVGVATGYGAAVLAVLLGADGWDAFGVIGTVAVVLLALGALLTVLRRVTDATWAGVLVVAALPAVLGIGSVAVERTWWGAGVAAALVLLEVLLLDTRARQVPAWLRLVAAGLVLPSVAVVVITAGALLLPGSGSPVLLPVVAVLAAAAAVAAPAVADRVRRRAPGVTSEQVRPVVELAAAGTGTLALLLGVGRSTTGADTVLVLCAVLAAGASVVARQADRRPVWWGAALLWCGVVWSALAWRDVGLVEAYTAPPAAAAILVGALLARRSDRWRGLVGAGVALAVVPSLLLAASGRAVGVRSAVLLGLAAATVAVGLLAARRARSPLGERGTLRALAGPSVLGGGAAALAGTVRAVHLAATTPAGSGVANARLLGAALLWSLLGALLLGALGLLLADRAARAAASVRAATPSAVPGRPGVPGGRWPVPVDPTATRLRRAALLRRWSLAPALVAGTVGTLAAARPSWALTWTGWVVELALLALAVVAVRSEARRTGDLLATAVPPGWALWCLALAWAIGAWSPRELRVEVFALPLGLALTAMGAVALAATTRAVGPAGHPTGPTGPTGMTSPTGLSWPAGRAGSVATLTPGVLATLGPSMLAIWTDPMTWRAILVVVLALGFMLVGARQMLRAPLVVGAAALPVAVVSVFAAQIGRTISAGPWLLTLLAAGGLLLVLGIFAERRSAAGGDGEAARRGVLR